MPDSAAAISQEVSDGNSGVVDERVEEQEQRTLHHVPCREVLLTTA